MPKKFGRLNPGDSITADFMNSILDALNSLEARVSAAEKRLTRVPAGRAPRGTAKRKRKA
jgi:hypothetical protein